MDGGASAVKAIFEKAQSNMSGGYMLSFGGSCSDNGSKGDTPFTHGAGFFGTGGSNGGFGRAASLTVGTAGELAKGVESKLAGSFRTR